MFGIEKGLVVALSTRFDWVYQGPPSAHTKLLIGIGVYYGFKSYVYLYHFHKSALTSRQLEHIKYLLKFELY